VEAADLNSDSLGKALDHLYETGITELFASVSVHALRVFGIDVHFAHPDTTAFSLQGAYEVEVAEGADEPQPMTITYGYSKDHRPDLKQAILGLICANHTSIPTYLSALSGNVSDKTSLPEIAAVYLTQFGEEEETPILVADSALYAANTLRDLSPNRWVCRVPATVTDAQRLLAETSQAQMQAAAREDYFYHEVSSHYGEVEQRWLVVLHVPRREQELAQFEKRLTRERDQLDKAAKQLQRQVFNCETDAQRALQHFAQQGKYHHISGEITSSQRYAQPGRPTPDSTPITGWHLRLTVDRDDAAITAQQRLLGKYIVATNVLDAVALPTETLLTVYKAQNCSVERGFRFLKDPLFFAHSLFLKKPARIMALLMVMGLSLLVYALAEYHLRQQLVEQAQAIPDQKGKPTQKPTMRRVFQMFEGIYLLFIQTDHFRKRIVTNVQAVHLQIAALLGKSILKFYTFEETPL
jgi:transposase